MHETMQTSPEQGPDIASDSKDYQELKIKVLEWQRRERMKRLGKCYENSYWLTMKLTSEQSDEYRLVHGSVLARLHESKPRVRVPHAWVENLTCGTVIDVELGWMGKKSVYCRFHRAEVHKSFSREQALKTGIENGYWGEWD